MTIFLTGAAGYVGGTVARRLVASSYAVRGLVRDQARAEKLKSFGIEPVIGVLEDSELLTTEAKRSSGVIHTADSDHIGAVSALIAGLAGTNNPFLHTSVSSVVGDDARGLSLSPIIYDETTPYEVSAMKKPRRDIEDQVLAAKDVGVRSVVVCPSNIYGVGSGLNTRSVQIPMQVAQARDSGIVRYVRSGVNRWSQVRIDDVEELYQLAFERAAAGTYYFVENGEASFFDLSASLSLRLGISKVESWTVAEAAELWGDNFAYYTARPTNSYVT